MWEGLPLLGWDGLVGCGGEDLPFDARCSFLASRSTYNPQASILSVADLLSQLFNQWPRFLEGRQPTSLPSATPTHPGCLRSSRGLRETRRRHRREAEEDPRGQVEMRHFAAGARRRVGPPR